MINLTFVDYKKLGSVFIGGGLFCLGRLYANRSRKNVRYKKIVKTFNRKVSDITCVEIVDIGHPKRNRAPEVIIEPLNKRDMSIFNAFYIESMYLEFVSWKQPYRLWFVMPDRTPIEVLPGYTIYISGNQLYTDDTCWVCSKEGPILKDIEINNN